MLGGIHIRKHATLGIYSLVFVVLVHTLEPDNGMDTPLLVLISVS